MRNKSDFKLKKLCKKVRTEEEVKSHCKVRIQTMTQCVSSVSLLELLQVELV